MESDISNPFTGNTYPNLFETSFVSKMDLKKHQRVNSVIPKDTSPARDARYPAYIAKMEDARFITDYRPQCSKNITAGDQFHTKRWMIHHGLELMNESRRRQMEGSGASLPMFTSAPPPAARVYSTPFESNLQETSFRNGVGVERANAAAPELFGTFSQEASIAELQANRKSIQPTTHYEGGRNSIRGHF